MSAPVGNLDAEQGGVFLLLSGREISLEAGAGVLISCKEWE